MCSYGQIDNGCKFYCSSLVCDEQDYFFDITFLNGNNTFKFFATFKVVKSSKKQKKN